MPLRSKKRNVFCDGFLNQTLDFFPGFADREAAGKIGHSGAKTGRALFDYDRVFHCRLAFQSSADHVANFPDLRKCNDNAVSSGDGN